MRLQYQDKGIKIVNGLAVCVADIFFDGFATNLKVAKDSFSSLYFLVMEVEGDLLVLRDGYTRELIANRNKMIIKEEIKWLFENNHRVQISPPNLYVFFY
jgi:hypothetical protein